MPRERDFENLESIVDHLEELGEQDEDLHVGDVLDKTGARSFGPLLVIPSLVAVIPFIGAIPGMTILTGVLVIFIAAEAALGHDHIWVPRRVRDIPLDRKATRKGADASRKWARRIDSVMSHRLSWMTQGFAFRVTAFLLLLLGVMMLPTAVIPWGVLAPAGAVLVIALGLTARDGLVVLIGWAAAVAACAVVYLMFD